MGLSRKGFFFTFVALLLTAIFIVLFSSNTALTPRTTLYSEQAKVEVINAITKDLKDVFLPRVMVSSSKMAMDILIRNISENSMPIDDVSLRAEELLLKGTLYGVEQPEMANHTLYNWSLKITRKVEEHFRMKTNITFYNVRVYQQDPWRVSFAAEFNMVTNCSDITYKIGEEVKANISIIGLKDPLFLIHTKNRTIARAPTVTWNISETIKHIANATFTDHTNAPSFIMRMENDTRASTCCGIESILNSSFGDYDYSYIDYLFWNQTYSCDKTHIKYGNLFNVTEIWNEPSGAGEYVKLDAEHIGIYGLGYAEDNVCE